MVVLMVVGKVIVMVVVLLVVVVVLLLGAFIFSNQVTLDWETLEEYKHK